MNMEATLLYAVILAAALSAYANNINKQCQVHNERRITCSCIGNEEFLLPDNYNYANITSVSITECVTVNLHYNSLRARHVEEIIVQNVKDYLNFDVFIISNTLKLLKLSNISRIPLIANHTFVNLKSIDTFIIENALVENLEGDFSLVVSNFILTNVVIKRINKLNFTENGMMLRIVNSKFHNVTSSPSNLAIFQNVEIVNSTLEMYKPGVLSIQSNNTLLRDSFFSNVSMNLVAADSITINGICADGKSTLRVLSKFINSTNNRLPNEIIYPHDNQQKSFVKNNTVCKAGNCDCPKSNGQVQSRMIIPTLIIGCLLTTLSTNFFYLFYNYALCV